MNKVLEVFNFLGNGNMCWLVHTRRTNGGGKKLVICLKNYKSYNCKVA